MAWFAFALMISAFFAVVYVSVQQALRIGANEPQASMVDDIAAQLENGQKPADMFRTSIDIAKDMAPFIVVYDKFGKPLYGTGYLTNVLPNVPIGVLSAGEKGRSAVTWQPDSKIRIASVSRATKDYYVLGGRSLFVVENKIRSFTQWLAATWVLAMALIAGLYALLHRRAKTPKLVIPKQDQFPDDGPTIDPKKLVT